LMVASTLGLAPKTVSGRAKAKQKSKAANRDIGIKLGKAKK
jgi:hypothetical protein